MGPFSISEARKRKMRKKRNTVRITKFDKFISFLGAFLFFGGLICFFVGFFNDMPKVFLGSCPAIGLGFPMMLHLVVKESSITRDTDDDCTSSDTIWIDIDED